MELKNITRVGFWLHQLHFELGYSIDSGANEKKGMINLEENSVITHKNPSRFDSKGGSFI